MSWSGLSDEYDGNYIDIETSTRSQVNESMRVSEYDGEYRNDSRTCTNMSDDKRGSMTDNGMTS